MQVTLKLFAGLSTFLPPRAEHNAISEEVEDGATVRQLIERHNVPLPQCHLILINGIYMPRTKSGEMRLKSGDVVSVWPPVAGG